MAKVTGDPMAMLGHELVLDTFHFFFLFEPYKEICNVGINVSLDTVS